MIGGMRITNKKGFTLIELMVVITIASILLLGSTSIIRILNLSNINKITQKIDSELSKNKMLTMSKGNYRYIVIHWDSTNKEYSMSIVTSDVVLDTSNWRSSGTIITTKKLASELVTLSYKKDGSSTPIMIQNSALLINHNPGTGAFTSNCTQINVESGGGTKVIYLVTKTGNHYIESN